MDERAMTNRHLEEAERHILLGDRHIARQKELIAELDRDGHEDALTRARDLLRTFEATQSSHLEHRERLRAELAALG